MRVQLLLEDTSYIFTYIYNINVYIRENNAINIYIYTFMHV